jgi:hypothetical protein
MLIAASSFPAGIAIGVHTRSGDHTAIAESFFGRVAEPCYQSSLVFNWLAMNPHRTQVRKLPQANGSEGISNPSTQFLGILAPSQVICGRHRTMLDSGARLVQF